MRLERISLSITQQLGRWLSRWGVDADQYHWLLQASLTMDFRARSALSGQQTSSPTRLALLRIGFFYSLFSFMLAMSLRFAGVGTFVFATVTFGYAMAMMGMSILMEFGLVVISPDDFLILAHRPISSRTFFAVKCSNLLFYTMVLNVFLNVIPAFVGWTFPGAPWYFPLVYLAVAALVGIFIAAVVAAAYGVLLQRVNYERFKDLLAWCQILFSFVVFFGYQLFPQLVRRMQVYRLEDMPRLVGLLPPAWFASLNELGLGHFSGFGAVLGAIALLLLLVLLPGLLKSVSLDYADRVGAMVSEAVKRGTKPQPRGRGAFPRWLERMVTSDPEERAMFGFLFRMLRRNRQLKLQLYPNFGIIIALFVLGAMEHQNQNDPLAGGGMGMGTMLPLMTFLFAAMGFTAALPYSDEYQGGWIFHVAPIARPERFLKAIKKALFLVLFVPLLVLTTVLFSFYWPVAHAFAMSCYGLAVGWVATQAALFTFRAFPFSKKLEKGAQSERIVITFLMLLVYGVFTALTFFFNSHPAALLIIAALLLALSLVLGRLNNWAYARAMRQVEFAAE
jgi:hypothetical protein